MRRKSRIKSKLCGIYGIWKVVQRARSFSDVWGTRRTSYIETALFLRFDYILKAVVTAFCFLNPSY